MNKKIAREQRKVIKCAKCGTQLVCMNKYSVLEDNRKIYIWYVCPRRRKNDEKGCGHISLVELKKLEQVK